MVFGKVALLGNCRFVAVGVGSMVCNGFAKRRDEGGLGIWSFDIFPEVPFEKFVVGLGFPFSVVVV